MKMTLRPLKQSYMYCRGDEPQQLRQFKDALGLEITAAAEVHMNLARQLKRESAESGKGDITQKKVCMPASLPLPCSQLCMPCKLFCRGLLHPNAADC